MKKQSKSRGGARPNSGRKPGKKDLKTLEKDATLRAIKDRINLNAQRLVDAQLTLALGSNYLYRITYEGKGKNKKKVVEQVTDQWTIEEYLNGNLETSTSNDEEGYFFITAKGPDARSIDSLLDRGFGKAIQSIDLKTDDKRITSVTVEIITTNTNGPENEGNGGSPQDIGDGENQENNMS